MYNYDREIEILKKSSMYIEKRQYTYGSDVINFSSNDYLGLNGDKKLLEQSVKIVNSLDLTNYFISSQKLLSKLEEMLIKFNGFSSAYVVNSQYLANIALIKTLVKSNTTIFIDEEFNTSASFASSIAIGKVVNFKHNDAISLRGELTRCKSVNKIIMVEGVYTNSFDILNREIISLADEFDSYLIVDESHSIGTIGSNLLGVFDYYGVKIKPNYIKLFSLENAYATCGAVILCNDRIKELLVNRARLIDLANIPIANIALACCNIKYVNDNKYELKKMIEERIRLTKKVFKKGFDNILISKKFDSSKKVDYIRNELLKNNFLITAIKPPIVENSMIKLSINLALDIKVIAKFYTKLIDVVRSV